MRVNREPTVFCRTFGASQTLGTVPTVPNWHSGPGVDTNCKFSRMKKSTSAARTYHQHVVFEHFCPQRDEGK
jgi:hypothetical protein